MRWDLCVLSPALHQLVRFQPRSIQDDLLVFYAGLRDTSQAKTQLVYVIIGLYVIDEMISVTAPMIAIIKRGAYA
jgi:hypothetical protein